ncbi:hypothetical protein [Marinospirillum sp.]|uniref:hypothetical protein n=1 Tax=Marinospirillum sp. TaxID=2183934 RepID=UPI00384F1D2C
MKQVTSEPFAYLLTDHLGKIEASSTQASTFLSIPSETLEGLYLTHLLASCLPLSLADCLHLRMSRGQFFSAILVDKKQQVRPAYMIASPQQPEQRKSHYRFFFHSLPFNLHLQLLPLYQKLHSLEKEPEKDYLASHLHLRAWAEQHKQDISEAIHTLFEKSTRLISPQLESAL